MSGVGRIVKLHGHRNLRLARAAWEKKFAFVFQLPGWALVAPSQLAGEPGAVQNWLFSC